MDPKLREAIGKRGENIVELCLTNYENFPAPLFRPTHLGDTWPAVDFYVELTTFADQKPFFLVQAKSTAARHIRRTLRISSKKSDVSRLLQIPAPTYILGAHEPSGRVFVRSVHKGIPVRAISSISVANELTNATLQTLHDEVVRFWKRRPQKPTSSVFL